MNDKDELSPGDWDDLVSSTDEVRAVKYTQQDIDAAVLEEREACANLCIAVREQDVEGGNDSYIEGRQMGATRCMNAIKMRSTAL